MGKLRRREFIVKSILELRGKMIQKITSMKTSRSILMKMEIVTSHLLLAGLWALVFQGRWKMA